MANPQVAVVIAARNSARTIGWAIGSALRQPEVAEVLVMDDASDDDTASAAEGADDGTGRLSVHPLDTNHGPAAARNIAISRSSAPFIAILDADDAFLDGRFGNLFAETDWDLAADNIMFVDEKAATRVAEVSTHQFDTAPGYYLTLDEFVHGNISRRGEHRGELGFLKPVISRSFLDRHGLRYAEDLWLGEDYELYVRAMQRGARFRITRSCGYLATVRSDSLSGSHRTEDLRRLADADVALLRAHDLPKSARAALEKHERHVRDKYRLRRFLDHKSTQGLAPAFTYAFSSVRHPMPIVRGVVGDKMRSFRNRLAPALGNDGPPVRFLLPAQIEPRDN